MSTSPPPPPPPSLLPLFLYVAGGLVAATLLQVLVVLPFVGFEVSKVATLLTAPQAFPHARVAILLAQGVSAVCIFIAAPWLFLKLHARRKVSSLSPRRPVPPLALGLAALVTVVALPANAFFIEWNEGIRLPGVLEGLERWARTQEDTLAELTVYLTQFDNGGEFALALLVIAVVPAFGEELLFRGLLQNGLLRRLGNPHVAIWLAALIFSFFHFQFYGLLPRMLLGALFGYLYYWSGHLWTAIVAHFCNNAFTLAMLYFYQQGWIGLNPEDPQSTPLLYSLASAGLVGGLLYAFYRQFAPPILRT